MGTCRAWYEGVISKKGTVSGVERAHRSTLFWCSILLLGACCGSALLVRTSLTVTTLILLIGMTTVCLSVLVPLICMKDVSKPTLFVFIFWLCMSIAGADLNARIRLDDSLWAGFVLVTDLVLILRLGNRAALCIVGGGVLWFSLTMMEASFRFGLFDLPGLVGQDARMERHRELCDCTAPPCPEEIFRSLWNIVVSVWILLTDFAVTRGFARQVEEEQASMKRTIDAVGMIAELLAGYDVDMVDCILRDAKDDMPPAMHAVLLRLGDNLRMYRPYLPRSCLPHSNDDNSDNVSVSTPSSRMTAEAVPTPRAVTSPCIPQSVLSSLKKGRASMLVVNICRTLHCLINEPHLFGTTFSEALEAALCIVHRNRGLVDQFVGDRILAGFNTWHHCATHSVAAATSARDLASALGAFDGSAEVAPGVSIGAASAAVLHGDMGCTEMRHFTLLGVLPLVATAMERAARAFQVPVVCNSQMQRDAEQMVALRLLPRHVRIVKVSAVCGDVLTDVSCDANQTIHKVYEATAPDEAVKAKNPPEEWLYELDRWLGEVQRYNDSVDAYLRGDAVETALRHAGKDAAAVDARIHRLGSNTPLVVHL